jgi:hypothetical protein
VSYSASGVIFVRRLKSFGLALASFHGFTPLIAVNIAKLPELLGRHKTWGRATRRGRSEQSFGLN